MITKKDMEIISHLRQDARKKITSISKEMGMPVTTIYDKIKAHKRKGIIKKHVALLDYGKLGYSTIAMIALKVPKEKRDELSTFLIKHPLVNSLYRVNSEHDFLVEIITGDMLSLKEFAENLQSDYKTEVPLIFNLINELKKEEFLSKKSDIDALGIPKLQSWQNAGDIK